MKLSEIATGTIKVLKTEVWFVGCSPLSTGILQFGLTFLCCALLKSCDYNKKGRVTWIVNLYARSVSSVEVK